MSAIGTFPGRIVEESHTLISLPRDIKLLILRSNRNIRQQDIHRILDNSRHCNIGIALIRECRRRVRIAQVETTGRHVVVVLGDVGIEIREAVHSMQRFRK